MKKNIGVFTFYNNYNYGSLLQCYALQEQLKKMGCTPFVVNPTNRGLQKKIKKIVNKIEFGISCIRYPGLFSAYLKCRNESRRSCRDMGEKTRSQFAQFIKRKLNVKNLPDSAIKRLSKNRKDYMFIAGSDQVWGIGTPYLNPFGFLRCVDENNRFSYAASFGADCCPKWHKKKLGRYLKQLRTISVREDAGVDIVKRYGINCVEKHIDPVFLLDVLKWKEIEKPLVYTDYVFLFTLNEPDEKNLEQIKKMFCDAKFLYGPYQSKKIENYFQATYITFSPEEFIWLIDNSKCIITDSFHATAFSIIFHKPFCVFERNYQHNMPQGNRINTLLTMFNLKSHMIENEKFDNAPYNCDSIIAEEQEKARIYLDDIISQQ